MGRFQGLHNSVKKGCDFMAGRPPKPLELQSKHLTKDEIASRKRAEEKMKGESSKVYDPPADLPKPIKAIYKTLVEDLRKINILNDLDIELLSVTSHAIYEMKKARDILVKEGSVITIYDNEGNPVKAMKHPAVQVVKDFQAIFNQGCVSLGLSPSSRSKLAIMNIEVKSDDDDESDLSWLMGVN